MAIFVRCVRCKLMGASNAEQFPSFVFIFDISVPFLRFGGILLDYWILINQIYSMN